MKKVIPVLTVLLFFVFTGANAQPGPPPDGIPIDGGLSLFLAAGAVAGAKLLYDARKKSEEGDDAQDR
jgi:hypothetical protein